MNDVIYKQPPHTSQLGGGGRRGEGVVKFLAYHGREGGPRFNRAIFERSLIGSLLETYFEKRKKISSILHVLGTSIDP